MSGQVIEAALAEEMPAVFIPISITATLIVPASYLDAIEGNTDVVRMYVDNLAMEFGGDVVSVDIK